jgi:DNA-directed RNA polymerase subunit RPC12/RpoP
MREIKCPYCEAQAVFVDSAEVYGGRSYGMIYLCRPCKAYVGVHKGSDKPLGRLADAKLRSMKISAHYAFDHIWKDGHDSRKGAYKWLAKELGIEGKDCHIGMFDVDMCYKVVEACRL